MRKLLTLVGVLLAAHVGLLFVRPSGAATPTITHDAVNVGIVFDVGGRGDKSFNDGAYVGAERAERELGAHVRFVEPGDGADREAGLRLLAAEGMDLVIGVGFIFTDDLTQLAKEYPNVRFAGVDYSVSAGADGKVIEPPPNLAALKFREEEGSFLVGALAGLVGHSKKVGFIGGMDFPLIQEVRSRLYRGGEVRLPRLSGDLAIRRRHAGGISQSGQGQGAGAQSVSERRACDLSCIGVHGPWRV